MVEKIKMLKDRVLVDVIQGPDKTDSGLIIPESAKESPIKAMVVKVGPGTSDIPMDVKEGDAILHLPNAGLDVEIDKKPFRILRSSDIVLIL